MAQYFELKIYKVSNEFPNSFSRLASKKLVFALYSLVAMFCGASYAYHTGTISTMEKQYKFSNKKIGIIIGFSEITSILGSFFVPYYATAEGHYPRWIACGTLFDDTWVNFIELLLRFRTFVVRDIICDEWITVFCVRIWKRCVIKYVGVQFHFRSKWYSRDSVQYENEGFVLCKQ